MQDYKKKNGGRASTPWLAILRYLYEGEEGKEWKLSNFRGMYFQLSCMHCYLHIVISLQSHK